MSHLSSGVVNVAQFNPWQAHVIVVDACASRAGSGSIFSGSQRARSRSRKNCRLHLKRWSKSRSLPDEKRNCGME
jgi:hypothetical protein